MGNHSLLDVMMREKQGSISGCCNVIGIMTI
jgi:hypothetical protein